MFISAFLACFDLVLFRQCFFFKAWVTCLFVCLKSVNICLFLQFSLATATFSACTLWTLHFSFSKVSMAENNPFFRECFFSLGCQSLFEDCLLGILASWEFLTVWMDKSMTFRKCWYYPLVAGNALDRCALICLVDMRECVSYIMWSRDKKSSPQRKRKTGAFWMISVSAYWTWFLKDTDDCWNASWINQCCTRDVSPVCPSFDKAEWKCSSNAGGSTFSVTPAFKLCSTSASLKMTSVTSSAGVLAHGLPDQFDNSKLWSGSNCFLICVAIIIHEMT